MSAPIGPGDWVECVDAALPLYAAPLTAGAVYCVRYVREVWHCGKRQVGLTLVGITNPVAPTGNEYAYRIERFRPIYRPSESLLRDLLQPIPAELEPAE